MTAGMGLAQDGAKWSNTGQNPSRTAMAGQRTNRHGDPRDCQPCFPAPAKSPAPSFVRHTPLRGRLHVLDVLVERATRRFEGRGGPRRPALFQRLVRQVHIDPA